MSIRTFLVIGLICAATGLTAGVLYPSATASSAPKTAQQSADLQARRDAARKVRLDLPPGPTAWVPVIAEIRVVDHGRIHFERFFRRGDGSVRMEARSPVSNQLAITIHNFEDGLSYTMRDDDGWASFPVLSSMIAPPPRQPRVPDRAEFSPVTEALEGIAVVEYHLGTTRKLLAPQLNYLELLTEEHHGARQRQFFNIELAAPPDTLFRPEPGASIRQATSLKDFTQGRSR